MKLVYLIRHGQASFGAKDYDQLSEQGVLQSQLLGRALAERKIKVDRYELGSLVRHQQTFAAACGTHESGHENRHWNEFDHKDITQRFLEQKNLNRDAFFELNDVDKMALFSKAMLHWAESDGNNLGYVETWSQFKTRANQALQELIKNTQECALVFTSGGVISNIVAQIMQLSSIQTLMLNKQLVNTGVTKLLVTRTGVQVSTLNEYVHLEQQNNNKLITYR